MAVPNRKAIIESILAQFADQLTAPAGKVNDIGRRLLPHFIEAMPPEDAGKWGVLEKRTSKPYNVPYDILVWLPTREHCDVLTSKAVDPAKEKDPDPSIPRTLKATWGDKLGVLPKETWHGINWRDADTPIVPLGVILPNPDPIEPFPVPGTGDHETRIAAIEAWIKRPL